MTLAPASIYSIQGKKKNHSSALEKRSLNFLDFLKFFRRSVTRRSSSTLVTLLVVVVVKFYGSIEFCHCKLVEVSVVSCVHVLVYTLSRCGVLLPLSTTRVKLQ